ncbi:MAG: hypothetical protein HOI88_04835 [Phycisphaerae bacterium]|jgi:hypothetical protein|nr:hypothetical protein [Phycisphaerae bacterium]MBT6269656.1 hypothetical protein [Phycisphaerae bacterium]MBT6282481.1 hypothetical protein [Phycisphaerae bacterium]
MQIFNRFTRSFVLIAMLTIMPFACEDAPDSENAIQSELDQAILNLDSALRGSNTSALESVIAKTKRLRPTIPSQLQSKNIILATANEKLAQLSFQSISAEANAISVDFQRAVTQSNDISILRIAANSSASGTNQYYDLSNAKKIALHDLKDLYESQLIEATSSIESLESQIASNQNIADDLREKADALLSKAEKAGLINGHKTYKSGAKIMRDSQKTDMAAANLHLESQNRETPRREEAKAELEAIGRKLLGLEQTANLLRQLNDNAVATSANLRQIADELDNETAALLDETVAKANLLKKKWSGTSSLLHDAIKSAGQDRKTSKEAKTSRAIWKLDMELILGGIEESKLQFLRSESHALNSIIANGIVTSANKWVELEHTIASEIEATSLSANAAYDNAIRLADNAGAKSEMIKAMITTRIAVLNGEVQTPIGKTNTTQSNAPFGAGAGFSTPLELAKAVNAILPLERADGIAPATNLLLYVESEGASAQNFLLLLQKISNSVANLSIAVRTNLGEAALQQLNSESQASSPAGSGLLAELNLDTIVESSDSNATIVDVNGKTMHLLLTAQGWKINLKATNNEDPQVAEFKMMMLESFSSLADIMDTMTDKLNAGEITSLNQLTEAIEAADQASPF